MNIHHNNPPPNSSSKPAANVRSEPPLDPGGHLDALSFQALDASLRATPDLARESTSVLNPTALAKLVQAMRLFQRDKLGLNRGASVVNQAIVCIPDIVFRDRSRGGALYSALVAAYKYRQSAKWRNFDLENVKRFDDNVAMFKKMEKELCLAGHIIRPKVYFDTTVPQHQLPGLESIVARFDGTVVTDVNLATHIVAFDPEFDADTKLAEESDDPEKMYLRTMNLTEAKVEVPSMALVHWWFFPPSHDEWMLASYVEGKVEEPTPRPDGAWVVCCRYVRDVARFNEWGDEHDYQILDYLKKVEVFRQAIKAVKKNSKSTAHKEASAYEESAIATRMLSTGITKSQNIRVLDAYLKIPKYIKDITAKTKGNCDQVDLPVRKKHKVCKPSGDSTLGKVTMTELSTTQEVKPMNGQMLVQKKNQAFNRTFDVPVLCAPERLRGGGDSEDAKIKVEENTNGSALKAPESTVSSSDVNVSSKVKPENGAKNEPDSVPSTTEVKDLLTKATTEVPDWYKPGEVSLFEKTVLPEWFDGSAEHRNESSYISAREIVLKEFRKHPDRYMTGTDMRRKIPGDIGSLYRLHSFLTTYGFINGSAFNESTPALVRGPSFKRSSIKAFPKSRRSWTDNERDLLSREVMAQMEKRKFNGGTGEIFIDWKMIAAKLNVNVSADECLQEFMGMEMSSSTLEAPDNEPNKFVDSEYLCQMLHEVKPEVLESVANTALAATNNTDEARKATLIGSVLAQAASTARKEEDKIEILMGELLEQRIKKLEARTTVLSDVEAMLEAERVALELERRDLFLTRCRYWLATDGQTKR